LAYNVNDIQCPSGYGVDVTRTRNTNRMWCIRFSDGATTPGMCKSGLVDTGSACVPFAGESPGTPSAPQPSGASASQIRGLLRSQTSDLKSAQHQATSTVLNGIRSNTSVVTTQVNRVGQAIASDIRSSTQQTNQHLNIVSQGIMGGIGQSTRELKEHVTNSDRYFSWGIQQSLEAGVASLSGFIEASKRLIRGDIDGMQDVIIETGRYIRDDIATGNSALDNAIHGVEEGIKNFINTAIQGIAAALASLFDPLIAWFEQAIERTSEFVADKWNFAGDEIEKQLLRIRDIIDKTSRGEYTDFDQFIDDFEDIGANVPLISNLLLVFQFIPVLMQLSDVLARPFKAQLEHLGNENARQNLLPPDVAIRARFLGVISDSFFNVELAKQGFSDARIDVLEMTSRPLLGLQETIASWNRGLISSEDAHERFRQHGYKDSDIQLFESLRYIIPSPNDLISMAVREVFNPQIAERFGQYEDFPTAFEEYAKQQGISPEWAERYWAAHWDLPSPQMGFEMFQRDIIDTDDLKLLLKALDVMPFWRDRLIQLSYNPLTRVDVRRMYGLGVLDRAGVTRSYLNLGYSPENAELMTEFTIRYEARGDEDDAVEIRALTRTVILGAYTRGLLSEDEAIQRLSTLGYSDEDAALLVSIADYSQVIEDEPDQRRHLLERMGKETIKAYTRRLVSHSEAIEQLKFAGYGTDEAEAALSLADLTWAQDVKESVVASVREMYITRTINADDLIFLLTNADFSITEIQRLQEEFDTLRAFRTRKPSRADFKKAMYFGLITPDEYIEELRGLGYADKYAFMLAANDGVMIADDGSLVIGG